jgi:hypothetical protein
MSVSSRRKNDVKSDGNGSRVKLRLVELDVEGGTADLVEGLKSLAATLRGTGGALPGRALAAAKPNGSTSAVVEIDDAHEDDENLPDAAVVGAADEGPEATPDDGADSRKRRPAPKAPKFLSDLDLTKAPVQLNDFVQEKNPGGDMDKYAVIAAWFKQHLSTGEITIDHIFTAYKALGWQAQLPDDLSQTFRNLKSNKNWFDSGSKRGTYKINWNGESAVNKMGAAKP